MKRLEFEKQIGIFVDHRTLINQLYRDNIATGEATYQIKQQLFNFHPNAKVGAAANVNGDAKNTDKSKRKRKCPASKSELTEELHQLQQTACGFLQQLHALVKQKDPPAGDPLPRYWEDSAHTDFPTFHGANATSEFHTFHSVGNSYLIPPRCHFYNYNVLELAKLLPQLPTAYDLITLDPPWRNKYIRRLKRARQELAYPMLDNEQLRDIPITRLTHSRTLIAIWCTNSAQHQDALRTEFLPAWNLRLVHTLKWLKLNTALQLINPINGDGRKQPFECLFIACHRDCTEDFTATLKQTTLLLSVPSIIHSHKPPLLPWLRPYLRNVEQPKCLELFARYLQPEHTSIGLEVLKLMDKRLYDCP